MVEQKYTKKMDKLEMLDSEGDSDSDKSNCSIPQTEEPQVETSTGSSCYSP